MVLCAMVYISMLRALVYILHTRVRLGDCTTFKPSRWRWRASIPKLGWYTNTVCYSVLSWFEHVITQKYSDEDWYPPPRESMLSNSKISFKLNKIDQLVDLFALPGEKKHIGGTTLDCFIWSLVDSVNLTHIRVQHLVLSSTTLEYNTWSGVERHQTATLHMLNHIKVLQSNVVQP